MRWSLLEPRTSIPGGGWRPDGSVSWRPIARIDCEMSPRSAVGDVSPNAVCPISPHGCDGLTFDSITSAMSVIASVCNPSIGWR